MRPVAMRNSRRILQGLLSLAVATSIAGCGGEGQATAGSDLEVGVYKVQAQTLTLTRDLPGRTVAYRVAEVRPQVSGIVEKRLFIEGNEVRQGQQLYQVDPRTYEAQLARAEANLITTENLARRYGRLLQANAVSLQQHDDAVANWKQAQAEARVARINVQYTKVLAPISGRIGRSTVTEGALVTDSQTQALATVTQLDPIYVDVTQPVTKLLGLQQALESGQLQGSDSEALARVGLILDDGSRYPLPGTLKFSEVHVDPSTGAVTLRAEFPNPQRKLLPGMFVRAQLEEGTRNSALLVPQQALLRDARGAPYVWLVRKDNTVERREVQTLRTVGNAWLIEQGLQEGDRIVVEGVQRARKGIRVQPVDASNVKLALSFGQQTVTVH
ncbi:hypothetical protein Q058_00122 [Pseudomonas aeruginosa BL04]|nr:hypothetical protein Q058_00122 [Pseudomonas aeruginosa BL04]